MVKFQNKFVDPQICEDPVDRHFTTVGQSVLPDLTASQNQRKKETTLMMGLAVMLTSIGNG